MRTIPIDLTGTLLWSTVLLGAMGCSAFLVDKPERLDAREVGHIDKRSLSGMRTLDSLSFTTGGYTYDLVIRKHSAEDSIEAPHGWEGVRPLLLYRYTTTGQRDLVVRNDSLVMCQGCGGIFGDPYSGIEFLYDTLKVHHYGGSNWRWSETHGFIHGVHGDWPLVLRTSVYYSVFDPDSTMEITNHVPLSGDRLANCSSAW